MVDAFFTDVPGPIPFGGLLDRPADLQGLPAGPDGPRQAHGGPPSAGRLLLALVRLAGHGHVRHGHAGPAVARPTATTRWPPRGTKMAAAFEFFEKIGIPYYCFHDRDVAPEGESFATFRSNLDALADDAAGYQERTGVRLLWGTANLFTHPRYQAGAATNPDPEVFAYAAAQVKHMLEVTAAPGRRELRPVGRPRGLRHARSTPTSRARAPSWPASCTSSPSTSPRSASPASC